MELKETQLQSFIDLYEQEFGVVLTKSQAQQKASKVLQYVLLCLNPIPKNDIMDMPD